MKHLLAAMMVMMAASAAFAAETQPAPALTASIKNMRVYNDKKELSLTMPSLDDATKEVEYKIPYSPALSGIEGAKGVLKPNNELVLIRVKKAQGKPLTAEEEKTVVKLIEAEKAYALSPSPRNNPMSATIPCAKPSALQYQASGSGTEMTVTLHQPAAGLEKGVPYKIVNSPLIMNGRICNEDFLIARMKKSAGMPITQEEQAMIDELAVDTATYTKNQQSILPVCTMPNSKGQYISTSFMPGCKDLNEEQVKAAPYIEQDPAARYGYSIVGETTKIASEPTKRRYKLPAEARQKAAADNAALQAKWDARR